MGMILSRSRMRFYKDLNAYDLVNNFSTGAIISCASKILLSESSFIS